MSKHNKLWIGLLTAGLILTTSGCSKAPQNEVEAAKTSLSRASAAGAEQWAPAEWTQARAAMDAVEAELAAQEAKFPLFRTYGHTRELIASAEQLTVEAEAAAVAGKREATEEAEAALSAAETAVEETRASLDALGTCKRKPKGFAADLEAMTGSVTALEASIPEIRSQIDQESYAEATRLAGALSEQAAGLTAELTGVKAKIGC